MRESQTVLRFKREGAVEALQEMLRTLLTERFGVLPPELVARVDAIDEPQKLIELLKQMIGIKSLDDLVF